MVKGSVITILQARRDEKDFIRRGTQDYIDKVKPSVNSRNALVSALQTSSLSPEQLSNVAAIRDGTKKCENTFSDYVSTQVKLTESKAQWKQSGEMVVATLDAANKQPSDGFLRVHSAAEYFLHSVAMGYGSRAVGVIMPGMGRDVADGMRELRRRGGRVITQDKDSSAIYDMNREVVQNGSADEVVPVNAIAVRIVEALRSRTATRETT
jgi:hypothetical protein